MRIALIIHDVRSALNVGSLLRTADGLGVNEVFLSGYTPYPEVSGDTRLPHVRQKAARRISKTALGAEKTVNWSHRPDIKELIDSLKADGYVVIALEQTAGSGKLPDFHAKKDVALVVGSEVDGVPKEVLESVDSCLEIPMLGQKESFNVAVAAAIALYQLRWPHRV